jgi:hypothetical protein
LPKTKESNFFSLNTEFEKGLRYYERERFTHCSSGQLVGEVDPNYLRSSVAPQNVKLALNAVKLIVLLRNPVDRAYSHYWDSVRTGYETLPFETAIELEDGRVGESHPAWNSFGYVRGSLYFRLIRNWLEYHELSRFHFILFEDLVKDTQRVLDGLAEFLGLPGGALRAEHFTKENPAMTGRFNALTPLAWPARYRKLQIVYRIALPIRKLRRKIRAAILRFNYKPFRPPPMSKEMRRRLYAYFKEDIAKLEELTGLNLGQWQEEENQTVHRGP